MSVFTSRVTRTIEIPNTDGQRVTIRKLAPKQLAQAREAMQREAEADFERQIRVTKALGEDMIKAVRDIKPEAIQAATQADPLLMFDALTIAQKGIVSWTFPDVKRTDESVADLDEETVTFIATEVLKLTKPALYQTSDEAEADRKND